MVRKAIGALHRVLGEASFAAFMIALLLLEAALATCVLFVPLSGTPFEHFAAEFKVWCFGFDPERGTLLWPMVASFTTAPFVLAAFVAVVFLEPLRARLRSGVGSLASPVALALVVLSSASYGLVFAAPAPQVRELAFPGNRIRTSFLAPEFALIDHTGQAVRSSELRGRVVLVTAVYASCGTACPMILSEAKSAVATLSETERQGLSVIAITLDPTRDSPARLAEMARQRGLSTPPFHLATGDPATVEDVLDKFSIARRRNPETGIIDHQNAFLLVDSHGRLAYRLAAGSKQARWLPDALKQLVREREVEARGSAREQSNTELAKAAPSRP